ncbi:MAG: hypothetical protein WD898_03480 [Candidatus Paceibacterota bacterium]
MQFKPPKDNERYKWTNHVKEKMMYYGISESLIKRIIRFPGRIEEGIAPETVAVMQPTSNKKKPQEVWVMYQDILSRPSAENKAIMTQPKRRVISAWRYPGVSPIGKKIPIPDEILQELENVI